MLKPTPAQHQGTLFSSLSDILDQRHPLYILSGKIDWQRFEKAFAPLYCADNGRPAKPIRLMVGLLILKHLRNISDESVVVQWSENAYFQYFCGMEEFVAAMPCNATELVHFRKHIGEGGMELILAESIRVNNEDDDKRHQLKRNLGEDNCHVELIAIFEKILSQKRNSPQKIYSIHEPEVQCISKGKEHRKYEFGNKVSIIRSATGLILGATSFRNEYDGHTIEKSLEQVERLTHRKIRRLAGDRGYRGQKEVNGTQVLIPDTPKPTDSYHTKRKKHNLFCKRAGIEPTISHLKSDYRLGRNFYKGVFGDAVNVILAAAAYNFKRAMKVLLSLIEKLCEMRIFEPHFA